MTKDFVSRICILILLTGLISLNSCKPKTKTTEGDATTATTETPSIAPSTTTTPSTTAPTQSTDASARYAVTVAPDSVFIGKKNELFIKFKESEALDLSNPDGKSTGMTLTINFLVTNKFMIGEGSSIYVHNSQQRLVLDDGTMIPVNDGVSDSVDPESSKLGSMIFNIPAGVKPVKINLFHEETRNTVQLTLTKK